MLWYTLSHLVYEKYAENCQYFISANSARVCCCMHRIFCTSTTNSCAFSFSFELWILNAKECVGLMAERGSRDGGGCVHCASYPRFACAELTMLRLWQWYESIQLCYSNTHTHTNRELSAVLLKRIRFFSLVAHVCLCVSVKNIHDVLSLSPTGRACTFLLQIFVIFLHFFLYFVVVAVVLKLLVWFYLFGHIFLAFIRAHYILTMPYTQEWNHFIFCCEQFHYFYCILCVCRFHNLCIVSKWTLYTHTHAENGVHLLDDTIVYRRHTVSVYFCCVLVCTRWQTHQTRVLLSISKIHMKITSVCFAACCLHQRAYMHV